MGDNLPVVDLGTGKTVKQIAVGNVHACAILNDVKCWGHGLTGDQHGDENNRGDAPNEMGII